MRQCTPRHRERAVMVAGSRAESSTIQQTYISVGFQIPAPVVFSIEVDLDLSRRPRRSAHASARCAAIGADNRHAAFDQGVGGLNVQSSHVMPREVGYMFGAACQLSDQGGTIARG